MRAAQFRERLESFPIIAAIRNNRWKQALESPAEILFYLEADILTVRDKVRQAHGANKAVFVHLDLAECIGRDRIGLQYLRNCGVDGIISTRSAILRTARELGFVTVQRIFALDSQGMNTVQEMLHAASPDFMEIMPGVIPKVIRKLSGGPIPVIAGGLIDSKSEITAALRSGATAISTGCAELWEL